MRKALALLALLLSSSAVSAQTQPAQMGITPTTVPEVLQVLDNTKTWVPIGSINPATHGFSPVGGGGSFLVSDPSVGMAHGGQDNSPLLSALMNALGPSSNNGGSTEVVFPGVTNQEYTAYYFSSSFTISRNARYRCGSGRQGANSVELVFAAGVQGVIQGSGYYTSDGQYGGGAVDGCTIVSLGYGHATTTPSSSSITNVAMSQDFGNIIPASIWHVGDGVILTPFLGSPQSTAIPAVAPGAYVSGVSGTTLTLASGYTTSANLVAGPSSMVLFQLPASQKFTVQTTTGSNSVLVTGGPRLLVPGEIVWSDAFPFMTTIFSVSGTLGAQTLVMTNSFNNSVPVNATATHGSGSPGQLWAVPAGLKRDTTAHSSNDTFTGWPIGLEMSCSAGGNLNCTGSYDELNVYLLNMIGRWTGGNNTSASSSINEKAYGNFLVDFMNGASLGEVDVNFNSNSAESGHAPYPIMGNCDNQNNSFMVGGYIAAYGTGGCAVASGLIPPANGSPWLFVGPQDSVPAGSPDIRAGEMDGSWTFLGGASGLNCVGINTTTWFIFGVGVNQCATGDTMGLAYNSTIKAFSWITAAIGENQRFFGENYLGYNPTGGAGVVFANGVQLGNGGDDYNGMERALDSGFSVPSGPGRLQGDVRINQRPVSSTTGINGAAAWANVQVGLSTINGAVTAGSTTSFAVTACPVLPAGPVSAVAQSNFTISGSVILDQSLGVVASCVGATLTLTAPALVSSGAGVGLQFLQWRQAAHIANDAAGTSWPVATEANIASLAVCDGSTIGFGVVANGQTIGAAGYGAAVSATGSAIRPVFCDGASWTYH